MFGLLAGAAAGERSFERNDVGHVAGCERKKRQEETDRREDGGIGPSPRFTTL